MNPISDGVVIGVVLGLIFAAVSYYLYSRIGQLERKVGVMENILLDLKVTTEQTLLSATEQPEQYNHSAEDEERSFPTPAEEGDIHDAEIRPPSPPSTAPSGPSAPSPPSPQRSAETREMFVSEVPRARVPSSTVQVEREKVQVQVNYEAMTYKELRALAQQKGVSGLRTMSKAQVIDALKGNPPRQELLRGEGELTSWASGTVNFGEDGQGGGDTLGSTEGGALEEVSGPELSLVSDV